MGATTTVALPVQEDNDLFSGIKNLAVNYFDTTSQHNKHGKRKKHMSFQTVRGEDWSDAVADILKETPIGKALGGGTDMVKKGIKGAINIAGGEATLGATMVSELIDFIVDKAVDSFSTTQPVQEDFEPGTWVYIDRGKQVSKLHQREELAAESSMFMDSDDVLTKDVATRLYVPGFYVQHVQDTNVSIVYAFDKEEPMQVAYSHVRKASAEDSLAFEENEGMTMIRELYFLRENKDNIKYCKFQRGDEVIVEGEPYSVVSAEVDRLVIQDPDGNQLTVAPQAATKGESSHWRPIEPFRNAEFTFSQGDFAYRQITAQDETPWKANAILCVVRALKTETKCVVVDVFTDEQTVWDPRTLVKPPLQTRRMIEASEGFRIFKRSVIQGREGLGSGIGHSSDDESLCFAYGTTIEFPQVNLWGAPVEAKADAIVLDHTVPRPDKIYRSEPDPPSNSAIWYIAGGALVLGMLYAHGVE